MAAATRSQPEAKRFLRPVTAAPRAFSQALPWLLGSLGMTMAVLVGQVPWWSLFVFAGCVAWRYLIELRSLSMPSFLARLLVFVPMMLGIARVFGAHLSAMAMLTFLIALLSLKVLELRSARDFTVVALLGYFMTLSAFFYTQSLLVSLYLGVALVVNTFALVRAHGGSGRGTTAATARLAVVMTLQALPLVVLLFIIFPRVQGTFLRRLGGDTKGLTGMSSHLQPGSFSSLAQSTETAFRARILSKGPMLMSTQLYWRGLVMDVCEHAMSWRASEPGSMPADRSAPASARRVEQQITLVPQGERWMFALDHPINVQSAPESHAFLTTTSVLSSTTPLAGNNVIYTAVSEFSALGGADLSRAERERYTKLPPDLSPRSLALAQGWRTARHSEDDIVRSALTFFRDGHFVYTLNPGVLPPESALDTFLFRTRAGFCEHYAAAFCTLMRAAGLPARIIVGYQGGEYNAWLGGHYVVRQSDAHAWAEVYLTGRGWTRQDPTAVVAPDRVSFGADDYSSLIADGPLTEESRLDRLRRLKAPNTLRWLAHNTLLAWDGLDQQWNLLVLGYDQEQQWVFLQKLGVGNLSWLGGTMLTLVSAFSLLAAGTFFFRWWEHRGTHVPGDRHRRVYLRFCARLTGAGVAPRAEPEGPLDYARRAATLLPGASDEIRRITDLYIALRYAPPGAADLAARFRAAVAAFHPARMKT